MPPLQHAPQVSPTPDQVAERLRDVFVGSRGERTRRRIVRALGERPRNANQLAGALDLDYKTVRHHLAVLREVAAVSRSGDSYGAVYVPTARVRRHWHLVEPEDRTESD